MNNVKPGTPRAFVRDLCFRGDLSQGVLAWLVVGCFCWFVFCVVSLVASL